jgi:cytochrome o ubiquinol oxidase subunit IV
MSDQENAPAGSHHDTNFEIGDSTHVQSYVAGLAIAIVLTLASFGLARTHLVWGPGMPILLAVLAIAQMGVHLVFFMHVNATEEGENTALALGFGIFIVFLVVFGSMIIMNNLSGAMPTMEQLMKMQR